MEKPRESHEMKELKAFLEDAPEELKNLQVPFHDLIFLVNDFDNVQTKQIVDYADMISVRDQVKMRSVAKKMDFLYIMGKEVSEDDMHLNTTWWRS